LRVRARWSERRLCRSPDLHVAVERADVPGEADAEGARAGDDDVDSSVEAERDVLGEPDVARDARLDRVDDTTSMRVAIRSASSR